MNRSKQSVAVCYVANITAAHLRLQLVVFIFDCEGGMDGEIVDRLNYCLYSAELKRRTVQGSSFIVTQQWRKTD